MSPNCFPPKGVFCFLNPYYSVDMNKYLKELPLKVFLCHSHFDRDAVYALYMRLKRDRVQPWLDRESLLAGQNWEQEICKAILRSDVVIVCLSQGFDEQNGF